MSGGFFNQAFQSESESSSETESSNEEVKEVLPKKGAKASTKQKKKYYESSSEDDEDRKVLGKKEKIYASLEAKVKLLDNHISNRDFGGISDDFGKIQKEIEAQKEGFEEYGYPSSFLSAFAELEELIGSITNKMKKDMKKGNQQAFGRIKNLFTKYLTNNTELKDKIEDWKKNKPETSESDSDDSDKSTPKKKPVKKAPPKKKDSYTESEGEEDSEDEEKPKPKPTKDESGDDESKSYSSLSQSGSDDSSSDTSDTSSSDDDQFEEAKKVVDEPGEGDETPKHVRRLRWVKKVVVVEKPETVDPTDTNDPKPDHVKKEINLSEIQIKKELLLDYKEEKNVEDKIQNVKEWRGKVNFDKDFHLELLHLMLVGNEAVDNKLHRLEILLLLITSYQDDKNMGRETWLKCHEYLHLAVEIFISDKVTIEPHMNQNLMSNLENLEYSLQKAFRRTNSNSIDYILRLKDEHKILNLCSQVLKYFSVKELNSFEARTASIALSHLFYKHETLIQQIYDQAQKSKNKDQFYLIEVNEFKDLVKQFCSVVYKFGAHNTKIQVVLQHAYYLSQHDQYEKARELMVLANVSEQINPNDFHTQILYNQTVVQLGLAAFRKGDVNAAHTLLIDIASKGKSKELLGQAVSKSKEEYRSQEQDMIERKYLLPYHMHVNTELVDFSYMMSAMLLEIPNISAHQQNINSNVQSKPFRKLIENMETSLFNKPPEQSRDYIVIASRALYEGDWQTCVEKLFHKNVKAWDNVHHPEAVKAALLIKVKEAALQVFVLRSTQYYNSLSISDLCKHFEMDEASVKVIIEKLLAQATATKHKYEKFEARIDDGSKMIQLETKQPNTLTDLTQQASDRIESLKETNNKLFEQLERLYGLKNVNVDEEEEEEKVQSTTDAGQTRDD